MEPRPQASGRWWMAMKWRKSPEALVQQFETIVPPDPQVERRKMFGYPAAFVGGNMFMGLHQESLILRLPDEHRASFLSLPNASVFEPMPGRPMREYVVVPPGMLDSPDQLRAWTRRALEYVSRLPAKKSRKSPRAKAASKPRKTARRRPR